MYGIDNPAKEHLRTQKRLKLHTLFLCFWNSRNICSLPPSTSNMVKIAQIEKGIRKDVECLVLKVQCWTSGELQQIRISSLKSLIIASLPLEFKEVL